MNVSQELISTVHPLALEKSYHVVTALRWSRHHLTQGGVRTFKSGHNGYEIITKKQGHQMQRFTEIMKSCNVFQDILCASRNSYFHLPPDKRLTILRFTDERVKERALQVPLGLSFAQN